jgi:hypothetical protein
MSMHNSNPKKKKKKKKKKGQHNFNKPQEMSMYNAFSFFISK